MRQLGRLAAMTPVAFFALAFMVAASVHSPARVDVAVSPVSCRNGRATVTLSAGPALDRETAFAVHRDGRAVGRGRIGPEGGRTVAVRVRPGGSARISVKVEGQDDTDQTVRSSCERRRSRSESARPHPGKARSSAPQPPGKTRSGDPRPLGKAQPPGNARSLPVSGRPHRTDARLHRTDAQLHPAGARRRPADAGPPGWAVTAGGVTLTGGLIWWYATIWPRRVPSAPINPNRSPYGPRRYPGLRL
ncbi:hypothetical protein [Streptosporangium carneum]|uniref:hypothetical protein n=1 Tax=Streptosporangium carneum TaxID=47481 RepID=UPI0031EE8B49